MRKIFFVCSFLFAAVLMTGSAFAAPSSDGDKCVKDKSGIMQCTFGGSDIPGILQKPQGGIISVKVDRSLPSLIEYRTDFNDQFDRTIEAL